MKLLCPWVNRNSANYHYLIWSKNRNAFVIRENYQNDVVEESSVVIRDEYTISHTGQSNCELRLKGGRPKGSTDTKNKVTLDTLTTAKNEVDFEYHKAKEERGKKLVSNGTIDKIIKGIQKKINLPDCAVINSNIIRRRVARNCLVMNQLGAVFPLASIDIVVSGIIIQMAPILSEHHTINRNEACK